MRTWILSLTFLLAPAAAFAAPTAGEQIDRGAKLFGANCAKCHGDQGQGKKGPALVGKTALPLDPPATAKKRDVKFKTAADVFDWVKANMPPKGAKLSDEEYAAILAFDLKANGVT